MCFYNHCFYGNPAHTSITGSKVVMLMCSRQTAIIVSEPMDKHCLVSLWTAVKPRNGNVGSFDNFLYCKAPLPYFHNPYRFRIIFHRSAWLNGLAPFYAEIVSFAWCQACAHTHTDSLPHDRISDKTPDCHFDPA